MLCYCLELLHSTADSLAVKPTHDTTRSKMRAQLLSAVIGMLVVLVQAGLINLYGFNPNLPLMIGDPVRFSFLMLQSYLSVISSHLISSYFSFQPRNLSPSAYKYRDIANTAHPSAARPTCPVYLQRAQYVFLMLGRERRVLCAVVKGGMVRGVFVALV